MTRLDRRRTLGDMNKTLVSLLVLMSGSMAFAQATTSATPSTPAANELAAQPQEQAATEWKPVKSWAGDLRLRFRDQKLSTNPDSRIFEVLRARLAYRADIEQDLTGYLRLATATSAISANQTLGDSSAPGMQRRAFGLDLAYLEYRPVQGLQVWAGKTPVSFYSPAKDQLVYDADLDFEGASVKWASEPGDFAYFVNLGSSLVSENFGNTSGDIPDMALLGAQVGASLKAFGTWTADVAYYSWDNAQGRTGQQVTGTAVAANARNNGNTTDASGALASKFNILQASLDWQHTWGDFTTELYYDYANNGDASLGGNSYETGLVAKWKSLQLGYATVLKEADSQLGAFTDSDTNGGGTDTAGQRVNLTWNTTKNFAVALTRYDGKRSISTASPVDFSETQLDLMGSF